MRRDPTILPALVVAAWGLLLPLPASADRIYKYVDKDGLVTYSSTPPAQSEQARDLTELDMPGAPRPADVEAAKKRAEEDAKLARELLTERRQMEAEYDRTRAAAIERSMREEEAAMQNPYDSVYYPVAGYLPYAPMWGARTAKNRPPFRSPPPFFLHNVHKSKASFTMEPGPAPFRRR